MSETTTSATEAVETTDAQDADQQSTQDQQATSATETDQQAPDAHQDEDAAPDAQGTDESDESADDQQDQDTGPTTKLRAEAKRYRQRLRDAEAERDQLTEQLQAAQGEIVVAALTTELEGRSVIRPEDFHTLTGTTPADFLTEDGTTDRDKIAAGVKQLLTERPELKPKPAPFDSARGRQRAQPKPAFTDAFRRQG